MSRAPGVEGCTDGGCMWGHPGGMHTNAGCRCEKDLRRSLDLAAARRVIMNARAQQKEIARLTRERAEVAAELGLWKQSALANVRALIEARRDVVRLRDELETLAEEYRAVRRFGCDGSGGEWTRETIGYYFWSRARAALSGGGHE